MSFVTIARVIIFMIRKSEKNLIIDYIILFVLLGVHAGCAVITYEGFYSLLSVFGTALYTISQWHKSHKTYKLMRVLTGSCFIIYNIFIKNLFGFLLETILLVSVLIEIYKILKKSLSSLKCSFTVSYR